MKKNVLYILQGLFLFCFWAGCPLDADESDPKPKNVLLVKTGLWSDLGRSDYTYSVVPFVGRPFPNEFVEHSLGFDGEYKDYLNLSYLRWMGKHWGLLFSMGYGRVEYHATQSNYQSEFVYQFYQYWDGTWGEPIERNQSYSNPRNPTVKMEQQTYSLGFFYQWNLGQLELLMGASLDYSIFSDGNIRNLYFASSQLGSRSIMFDSLGSLDGLLEKTESVGGSLEIRLSYPILNRVSIFMFSTIRMLESDRASIQLSASEPQEVFSWYIYDEQDLQNRVQLNTFDASGCSIVFGLGIQTQF